MLQSNLDQSTLSFNSITKVRRDQHAFQIYNLEFDIYRSKEILTSSNISCNT